MTFFADYLNKDLNIIFKAFIIMFILQKYKIECNIIDVNHFVIGHRLG